MKVIPGNVRAAYDGQVIQNLDIRGSIELGLHSNVVVRNCIVRGTESTGKLTSFIYGSGDNQRGLLIEDCILVGNGNVWCSAMRGGNYTIRRTEISMVPDGLCFTSPLGNVKAEANWIHNGLYKEWNSTTRNMPYAGSYYTHTDGIQFHRGRNYVIRGNRIGGTRVPGRHHTGMASAISSGDDMYNSCLMIKQEVDSSWANKIENVLIERNWLTGGQASINLASGRGNNFASTIIRGNRFRISTWGKQYYILRSPGLGQFSHNTFMGTNGPVPISRGA